MGYLGRMFGDEKTEVEQVPPESLQTLEAIYEIVHMPVCMVFVYLFVCFYRRVSVAFLDS